MADFVSVLRRAVENLEDNNATTRAALYEKARAALLRQLQSLDPPLSEDELARQTEELNAAIADLEAEYGGPAEPAEEAAPTPPQEAAPTSPEAPPPGAADHREETPAEAPPFETGERFPEDDPYASPAHRTFRSAIAETETLGAASSTAARSARDALDGFPAEHEDDARLRDHEDMRPRSDEEAAALAAGAGAGAADRDAAAADEAAAPPPDGGQQAYASGYDEPGSDGIFRFAVWGIVALVLAGLVGVGIWQRDAVTEIVTMFATDEASDDAKIADRVPGSEDEADDQPAVPDAAPPAEAPRTGSEAQEPTDDAESEIEPEETLDPETRVAQALLVEEANQTSGATNSLGGSVDWSLVDDPEVPGGDEKVIRATIRIPDKNMSIAIAIRRNLDDSLPASHTIELLFDLPDDFENGGIERVPGMVMKATPQSSGQPLVGAVVPVTGNFFLIGLSQTDIDRRRNLEELQRRAFMDIPLVYSDGTRALLSLAKGESGTEVFAEAFTAWGS